MAARVEKGGGILTPSGLVEVDRQEEARFVLELGLAGLPALKSTGIDVFTTAEQRAEQGNLGLGRGRLGNGARPQLHECLSRISGEDAQGVVPIDWLFRGRTGRSRAGHSLTICQI